MKRGLLALLLVCLFSALYGQGSGYNLLFNAGTDTRVQIPDHPSFDHPGNTFTIEAWIYPTAYPVGDVGMIFDKHETVGSREFDMMITPTGTVRVSVYDVVSTPYINYSVSTVPLNRWTHVAHVYSYSSGKQYIYINGILDATFNIGSINIASTTIKPMIGCYWLNQASNTTRGRFTGSIEEVRLWYTERPQTAIRDFMCRRLNSVEVDLTAYYPLDEGSGLTTHDASLNSNTGTLINSPTWTLSSAPIGDQSTYIYTGSWTGVSLTLSSTSTFKAYNITTSPTGFHIYTVYDTPNSTSGISNPIDHAYYGTFAISPDRHATYDVDYSYPFPCTTPALYYRDHNADLTWAGISAVYNSASQILRKTDVVTRGEFIVDLCGTQPVTFISLTAEALTPNETHIQWQTGVEIDNAYFEVEAKYNSDEFFSIGRVNPNPLKQYTFTDNSTSTGLRYYRIKQVDVDGTVSYSSTVSTNTGTETFSLYPIPFEDELLFEAKPDTYLELSIYTSTGVLISTHPVNQEDKTILSTSSLARGFYIVAVKSSIGIVYRKVLKQ